MSDNNSIDNSNQTFADDESKLEIPRQYKVILHNDDYTPMEFVVHVLMSVFKKDELTATQIMLNVHNSGKGICGTYSYEIAETKVAKVHQLAEQNEYPLHASMEAE
ncbi:MAG: ATP-dependent Clp protease adapter ClpS [Proteobacteria bacterium]|nr:ATP-dependent Clp protease adapter ClpS [Pseudomonadota bacterium]